MLKEATAVLLVVQALVVYGASVCPDRDVCEDNHTCCHGPTGEYSCCPHHQGECCDDHLFCCPEHTICLMEDGHPYCGNATISLKRTERIPARQSRLLKSLRVISTSPEIKDAVVCQDRSFCPAEFSCVKLPISFGCCPITQGIVCADGKHCCPEGLECSADGKSCVHPREPMAAVICSDGKSECPQGASCCQSSDGTWGCCPIPQAVCCDDKEHCCPVGSTCDVKNSKCISSTNQHLPMWSKFPARLRANWEDQNGDAATPQAVTVKPKPTTTQAVTANPEPTTTQAITAKPETTSTRPNAVTGMTTKPSIQARSRNVPCNDTVACEDGSTCCKTATGDWACCPLPKAVCCEDHTHCCPEGTTCDVAHDTCLSANGPVPMLKKLPALPSPHKENNVTCDSTSSCPDGSTCCKTEQGQWACCPLPEAVCCEDHVHCCPKATTCDVAAGTCLSANGSVPMLTKLPVIAVPPAENNVTCDSSHSCPDGSTCCKNEQGEWACCPLPEAVCCDDHIHCCPKGTTCDVAAGTCLSPTGAMRILTKLPALSPPKEKKVRNVPCNDTVACEDGSTCCKTATGDWACCPLPKAVCCEDHTHCCPEGTTCDVAHDTCLSANGPVPMLKKLPALPSPHKENNVTCDSTSSCPDGSTCCKNEQGEWACCPLPEAVCCEDHVHCCPKATTCDVAAGTCLSANGSVPMLTKLPVIAVPPAENNVTCDSSHSCPDSSTCCKNEQGEWACCPLPKAVCCDDHIHCCPNGMTCDLKQVTCNSPSGSVPMLTKLPATAAAPEEKALGSSQCDITTSCPDRATCCFMKKEKKWGCCPFKNALCCEDGEHCCPAGYKCGTDTYTCTKGNTVIPWYNKLPAQGPARSGQPVATVTCDSHSSCPSGSSCCQLANGKWGCCPLTEAVCCSDQAHCCPRGYSCNLQTKSCEKSFLFQAQMLALIRPVEQESKKPADALMEEDVQKDIQEDIQEVQCDDEFSCRDKETCCRADGGWGCCPAPKATCCADRRHCCPAGYTCGVGGTCIQGTSFRKDNWRVFFSKKKRALVY